MSQIERIRDMLADGYTPTEVKETLGVSYPTIRKYAQEDDFSPQRPKASEHPSKLDPYKAFIGEMLEEDRHCYHKQRHTAKRVFKRLCAEHGFSGSYSTVQRYMKEIRSKGPRGESVRLGWGPGTMQVDFGQADFDYAFGGGRTRMHYLPMSFPYSNHEVCEVFADEKDVCVCQVLKDCFERIGGVPPRHRARQRHRGREEVARRDRGVRPLPPAQAALRLHGPLLQPERRQGEGKRRGQGRLHQEELLRARARGGRPSRLRPRACRDA